MLEKYLSIIFSEPCTVTNSDSFLIVNIVESLGSQTSQETQPKELPLSGTYYAKVYNKHQVPKIVAPFHLLLLLKNLNDLEYDN